MPRTDAGPGPRSTPPPRPEVSRTRRAASLAWRFVRRYGPLGAAAVLLAIGVGIFIMLGCKSVR